MKRVGCGATVDSMRRRARYLTEQERRAQAIDVPSPALREELIVEHKTAQLVTAHARPLERALPLGILGTLVGRPRKRTPLDPFPWKDAPTVEPRTHEFE